MRSTAVADLSTSFVTLLAGVGLNAAGTPATVAVNVHKRTLAFCLTSKAYKQFEWLGVAVYGNALPLPRRHTSATSAQRWHETGVVVAA